MIIKIIDGILSPLGLIWLVLVVSALVLLFNGRIINALLNIVAATGIYISSSTDLPAQLLVTLETQWVDATIENAPNNVDAIVMLGGIAEYSPYGLANCDFNTGVDRLLTALECLRRGKSKVLILGGGKLRGEAPPPGEGQLLLRWFSSYLPEGTTVYTLDPSSNTREEAIKVKQLCQNHGWDSIILITSAFHMKRSIETFQTLKLKVHPVACDFEGIADLQKGSDQIRIFSPSRLLLMHLYFHEKIGWYYYQLRGWIKNISTNTTSYFLDKTEPTQHTKTIANVPAPFAR